MTNQEYMDVLEKYANHDVTVRILHKTGNLEIEYAIETDDYGKISEMSSIFGTEKANIEIMLIKNSKLYMPVSNIMDVMLTRGLSHDEHRSLYRSNNSLYRIKENRMLNQISGNLLYIPSYEDEAESFQRELSGEIILYKSHIKYLHQIVENGYSKIHTILKDSRDNLPKM